MATRLNEPSAPAVHQAGSELGYLVCAVLLAAMEVWTQSLTNLGLIGFFLASAIAVRVQRLGGNPSWRDCQRKRVAGLAGAGCVAMASLAWTSTVRSRMDIGLHVVDWEVDDWVAAVSDNRLPDTPQRLKVPASWWRFTWGAPPTIQSSEGTERSPQSHGFYPLTVYNPYKVVASDDQEFLGFQLQRALREELGVDATLEEVRRDFSRGLSRHAFPIWDDASIVRELKRRKALPLGPEQGYVLVALSVCLFLGLLALTLRYQWWTRRSARLRFFASAARGKQVVTHLAIVAAFGLALWAMLSVPSRSSVTSPTALWDAQSPPTVEPLLGMAKRLAEGHPVVWWLLAITAVTWLGQLAYREFVRRVQVAQQQAVAKGTG